LTFVLQPSGHFAHLVNAPDEDEFLANAPFMYSQIKEYMEEPDEDGVDDVALLQTPSFIDFCDLGSLSVSRKLKKKAGAVAKRKGAIVKTKSTATQATTTPLVREIFGDLFSAQMGNSDENVVRIENFAFIYHFFFN
jgi:hypothetical protein